MGVLTYNQDEDHPAAPVLNVRLAVVHLCPAPPVTSHINQQIYVHYS